MFEIGSVENENMKGFQTDRLTSALSPTERTVHGLYPTYNTISYQCIMHSSR